MDCENCGKKLYKFNFLSSRKYEKINDDEILLESHDFCSKECKTNFEDKLDLSDDFIHPGW